MLRELSIDASQVALGDDSTLTLTLTTEQGDKTSLADWLRQSDRITLTFDHLGDSRAPESLSFFYEVKGDHLLFAKPLRVSTSKRPRSKPLFGELELMTPKLSLKGRSGLQIAWDVRTWDIVGTYTAGGASWCGRDGCQWRVFRNVSNDLKAFQTSPCVSERTGTHAYSEASSSRGDHRRRKNLRVFPHV